MDWSRRTMDLVDALQFPICFLQMILSSWLMALKHPWPTFCRKSTPRLMLPWMVWCFLRRCGINTQTLLLAFICSHIVTGILITLSFPQMSEGLTNRRKKTRWRKDALAWSFGEWLRCIHLGGRSEWSYFWKVTNSYFCILINSKPVPDLSWRKDLE